MSYKIITDATSDLPLALAQQWGVEVLPMDYTLDGQPHTYAPGNSDVPLPEIFNAMRNGAVAVTSQINAFSFTKAFEPYLQQGLDIIYIGFSSALSGTVASAGIAKAELLEKYPDRKIAVVDSLCASMGQGLYVYYAARLQKELDFDAMVAWLEENKLHFVHWFTVDDLVYLKRGGRVSGATAAIATVLQIKPVMHVDELGRLIAIDKVQGRKKPPLRPWWTIWSPPWIRKRRTWYSSAIATPTRMRSWWPPRSGNGWASTISSSTISASSSAPIPARAP